jgi:hypothetical protein
MTDAARPLGRAAACLLLALATPARAGINFGDIDITPPPISRQQESRTHGYFEYVFLVTNQSAERPHVVSLRMPNERYIIRGDYLREVYRSVRVGPGETVRLTLLQPDYPPVGGKDIAVFIDDRRQERELPLTPNETRRYSSLYSGSGGYGLLVLANPAIAFPKAISVGAGGTMGMMGGMPERPRAAGAPRFPPPPSPPGGAPVAPGTPPPSLPPNTQIIPAEPVESWSTDWLTYSRYDGIVLTGDDLKGMPPAVRTALWQYVETGGSLAVLGTAELPESWRRHRLRSGSFATYEAGFGECLVHPDDRIDKWDGERLKPLADSWMRTAATWQSTRNTQAAHEKFPVVDDLGIPVKGLFILMLLFTLAIGPVNLLVLSRRKRRIWLLWTTPVISLLTCLAVLGYMLISEGWRGHLRTETVTLLDEGSHRATTVGWTGVYSPLTPSDGLHFRYETEVVSQRARDWRRPGARACTLDWSVDQHLASGWVEARVPALFRVRKSELRRERVVIHREPNGQLSMVNGLGAAIRRFWYADNDKLVYTAADVTPGARVNLEAANVDIPDQPGEELRQIYLSDNWLLKMQEILQTPLRRLRPSSYLAELDDSPFLEDALPGAGTRKCHVFVLGLMKTGDQAE